MAGVRLQSPVLLVVAAFARRPESLQWGRDRLEQCFGPIALAGTPYPFSHTDYYTASMGANLTKQLLGFRDLVAPDCLAAVKRRTNALEQELAAMGDDAESRPLNLDPGVLHLGKFLLATTKDQAHRIYLSDGIFAEVTLRFEAGAFEPWPWTYADYREEFVRVFLQEARVFYKARLQEWRAALPPEPEM